MIRSSLGFSRFLRGLASTLSWIIIIDSIFDLWNVEKIPVSDFLISKEILLPTFMAISSWIEHSHVDSELLKYQYVIDYVMRNENTRRNGIVLIAT
ncbi:MAG: hypothetical protein WBE34_19825, partial [Candidatus Nitrosopolaris sp.]